MSVHIYVYIYISIHNKKMPDAPLTAPLLHTAYMNNIHWTLLIANAQAYMWCVYTGKACNVYRYMCTLAQCTHFIPVPTQNVPLMAPLLRTAYIPVAPAYICLQTLHSMQCIHTRTYAWCPANVTLDSHNMLHASIPAFYHIRKYAFGFQLPRESSEELISWTPAHLLVKHLQPSSSFTTCF